MKKGSHYVDGKVGSKDNENIKIISCEFEDKNDMVVKIDSFKDDQLINADELQENTNLLGLISVNFLIIVLSVGFIVITRAARKKTGWLKIADFEIQ